MTVSNEVYKGNWLINPSDEIHQGNWRHGYR